ncbi:GntR family transcriptional regulator [Rhodococcus koreensis]|uniref:GntR family transcriptional regulator n=1 Tax=Rhodococcus koreensis TaxID=99653 RepID=UPI003672C3FA
MTDVEGAVLRPTTLRDRVIAIVRQALVSGEIRPGEMYSAAALAARLGVSSSPVREALLTLVSEGLMEPVRNRGYRVVPMSEQDLDEVYQMRVLLEVPATLQAAEQANPDDIASLETLVHAADSAAQDRDLIRFVEADRHFHLSLLSLCGNKRLVGAIASLRDQARLYGLASHAERGTLIESAREHHEILDALAAKDLKKVDLLIRAHLRHTRSDWAQPARRSDAEPGPKTPAV